MYLVFFSEVENVEDISTLVYISLYRPSASIQSVSTFFEALSPHSTSDAN